MLSARIVDLWNELDDSTVSVVNVTAFKKKLGKLVSRQLVYGHFVYDTSSTDISSTDISSTMTFLAEIEAGVIKQKLYQ